MSALAGCAPPPGFYAPIEKPVARQAPEAPDLATGALDPSFVGLRFDPSRRCPAAPVPRFAPTPFEGMAELRAASDAPRLYGSRDELWRAAPLSVGDVVGLRVADGAMFDGDYAIGADGTIRVPLLPPVSAAGRSLGELERALEQKLVRGSLFHAHTARVSANLRKAGELSSSVGGAVFSPGLVSANEGGADSESVALLDAGVSGSETWRRRLSGVLKAAGGVRPDADLARVAVKRGGRTYVLDMTGALTGAPVQDPVIADGDYVFVPSRGCFAADLARPSRVTPPGIRVFISNPTAPIYSNNSAAVGSFSTRLPYGARLLQALASGNCIGGATWAAAQRYALLVGESPLSGRLEAMRVDLQTLMREPQRDDLNPYLQPGDAIACYDGVPINLRDLAGVAAATLSPVQAISALLK